MVSIGDRETGHIRAKVVKNTKIDTLQSFITETIEEDAIKYTDEYRSYVSISNHKTVQHRKKERVREE